MKFPRLTVKKAILILVAAPFVGFGLLVGAAVIAAFFAPETWEEASVDVETEEVQQTQEPVERASSFIGTQEQEPNESADDIQATQQAEYEQRLEMERQREIDRKAQQAQTQPDADAFKNTVLRMSLNKSQNATALLRSVPAHKMLANYYFSTCDLIDELGDDDDDLLIIIIDLQIVLQEAFDKALAERGRGNPLSEDDVYDIAFSLVTGTVNYGCTRSRSQASVATSSTKTMTGGNPILETWSAPTDSGPNVKCIFDGPTNLRVSPNLSDSSIKAQIKTGSCGTTSKIENGFVLTDFLINELGEKRAYWVHESQLR